MGRQQTSRGALLTSNLPQLQNLIKRDPAAYREEFMQQYTHYQSIRTIFQISPDDQAQHFRELTTFIAQVKYLSSIVSSLSTVRSVLERHGKSAEQLRPV